MTANCSRSSCSLFRKARQRCFGQLSGDTDLCADQIDDVVLYRETEKHRGFVGIQSVVTFEPAHHPAGGLLQCLIQGSTDADAHKEFGVLRQRMTEVPVRESDPP